MCPVAFCSLGDRILVTAPVLSGTFVKNVIGEAASNRVRDGAGHSHVLGD